MQHTAFGIALFAIAVVGPWWLTLLCTCIYVFRYTAYEIVFFAMVLDLHFGNADHIFPVPIAYTLAAGILIVAAESIKPFLRGTDVDYV